VRIIRTVAAPRDREVQSFVGQTSRRGTRRRRPTETLPSSMLGFYRSPGGPKDAAPCWKSVPQDGMNFVLTTGPHLPGQIHPI
jgi:hypothetical protein